MENSTKERLTGALILVAALVILVPEILSRPRVEGGGTPPAQDPQAGPPLRTYDMALDPSADANRQPTPAPKPVDEVAAVPPPVTETAPPPVVAEPSPPAATPDASTAMTVPDAAAASQPAAKPAEQKPMAAAEQPAAVRGSWWVQAGVFASADNAQRLGRELNAAGIPTVVSQITAQGKQMHRVRAGPVADRSAALALQAKLAAKGHKSTLVAP